MKVPDTGEGATACDRDPSTKPLVNSTSQHTKGTGAGASHSTGEAPAGTITTRQPFRTHAQALAAEGWPVFPMVPRSKSPYAGSHAHLDATTDPVVVSRWATEKPEANLGVRVPESVVVLDEDRRGVLAALCRERGVSLPPTREVRTRRGRHLYYRLPEGFGPSPRKLTVEGERVDDVDVKRSNGFVIGPGSLHESGRVYRLTRAVGLTELPQLPDAWLAWVTQTTTQGESSGDGGGAATAGTVPTAHHPRRLGQVMRVKREGQRRDFLQWALCQAHRNYTGDDLAEALAELEVGALAAGLEQPDIDGLAEWAARQFAATITTTET